ncbi:nucleophosmin 1b [Triplophysa dalaica]|uniref:nucleophosmin 1b n=1 Tax=Triplophysa dalaica TaxID=1582913 RepID=UPI0024DFD5B4|nr:nucleophosmin 1b [Triplophysa dalaica]
MEDNIKDLSRPQMYLFGCSLKGDKKEHRVEVDDDEAEHQLSLKSVCLGAEAEDKFHIVEMEGLTYDGKTTKITLAVLKPSVLPCLSLGGFEVTPPVSFRLQSGAGPVHISGQHFVSTKESDDEDEEEENNTSPVKRPSNMTLMKVPQKKKLKMDSDEDEDSDEESEEGEDDEDEEDDDDEDNEKEKAAEKTPVKTPQKSTEKKSPNKQNGSPNRKAAKSGKSQDQTPQKAKDKSAAGPSGKSPTTLNLSEVKSKLASAAKEGRPLPKTEQKFENYAKSSFKITDKQVIKDLWNFVQSLKK